MVRSFQLIFTFLLNLKISAETNRNKSGYAKCRNFDRCYLGTICPFGISPQDDSPHGHFTPWTSRPLENSTPWSIRPLGQFDPWTIRQKTIRPLYRTPTEILKYE